MEQVEITVDFARVAADLKISVRQVESVVALLDEGNTVPFITRYRKERTGNLNEDQIRDVQARVGALRQLADRAETILRQIESQKKLTPALRKKILAADTLKRLEDLYLPYRQRRKSRAMAARERGLEPLADRIWQNDSTIRDLNAEAAKFVDAAKDLPDAETVLRGVRDIMAERIAETPELRELARRTGWKTGRLAVSEAKGSKDEAGEFRNYIDYAEAASRIPPHRILAINRGEKASALRVRFEWDNEGVQQQIYNELHVEKRLFTDQLIGAANDAISRLIQPAIEREVRRELTDKAEQHAVDVFAKNLKMLLLQPPLQGRRVVAIDPGLRTGCKIAALDELGNLVDQQVLFVTGSDERKTTFRTGLAEFLRKNDTKLVCIGNGTACRETEELVAEMIVDELPDVEYIIVNEAGASVYSTSSVAKEEFPEHDATVRGTISIGRRLQDPLSELVKIDPRHIGVGMYQHDVNPKLLQASLDAVIESCVNFVGVNLNTASASLLKHVSGLNARLAKMVVDYRDQQGGFKTRQQLLDVPGVGKSTFTQAAGFLKITTGEQPLDRTWIHPESYEVTNQLLNQFAIKPDELVSAERTEEFREAVTGLQADALADELAVGQHTLTDIVDALLKPGRDPRVDLPKPIFRQGILKMDDLTTGMELQGTVLNVVDFGAFVDIGLKGSGLIHISQLSTGYVASPHDLLAVGDVVTVWVMGIDRDRQRVSLTMISPEAQVPEPVPARNS